MKIAESVYFKKSEVLHTDYFFPFVRNVFD